MRGARFQKRTRLEHFACLADRGLRDEGTPVAPQLDKMPMRQRQKRGSDNGAADAIGVAQVILAQLGAGRQTVLMDRALKVDDHHVTGPTLACDRFHDLPSLVHSQRILARFG